MSDARFAKLKLRLCRAALIVALPCACATGVKPELDDTGDTSEPTETAGSSSGGMPETAGTSALPHSGSTSVGGNPVSNPFGGTSSAGKSGGGTSSAGTASGGTGSGGASSGGSGAGGKAGSGAGGKAGSSAGGSAGAGGKGGADGGGGSGGAVATGSCATCPTPPKTWADNTNISFGPGDCFDVSGALYLYTGKKAQTWANKDCNPTKQLSWCSDPNTDYNFMLCK